MFFDLSKAFNSLPHPFILDSLVRVGIGREVLMWIRDNLSDRSQQVVLRGIKSPAVPITSGVPQGSILGPLLFIITIDSIIQVSISTLGRFSLFADGICYYRPVSQQEDILAVQNDVDLIYSLVEFKKLSLNASKTKCMLISRKRNPPNLNLMGYKLGEFNTSGCWVSSFLTTLRGLSTLSPPMGRPKYS